MDGIDKLTLELLMNKTNYNKYIEKTDPKKHQEHTEYKQKLRKYKSRMISLTNKYMENPDYQVNLEMNEMFSMYAKTCIQYFEIMDLENEYSKEKKEKDEDMMFDPTQMTYEVANANANANNVADANEVADDIADAVEDMETASIMGTIGSSFWSGDKVMKTPSRYTMDKYVKRK
jgi:hypothetical protein